LPQFLQPRRLIGQQLWSRYLRSMLATFGYAISPQLPLLPRARE